MAFEGAHAVIDTIISRTRGELNAHRNGGHTDEDFIAYLVTSFVEQAEKHPAPAGSVHMAFAVYRLAVMQEEIETLQKAVDVLQFALGTLSEISDL